MTYITVSTGFKLVVDPDLKFEKLYLSNNAYLHFCNIFPLYLSRFIVIFHYRIDCKTVVTLVVIFQLTKKCSCQDSNQECLSKSYEYFTD